MHSGVVITFCVIILYCQVTRVNGSKHKHDKHHKGHGRRFNHILRALAAGQLHPWSDGQDVNWDQMEFFCKISYNSSELCSSRGSCIRGRCICDEVVTGDPSYGRYMGQYCQYDVNQHVCAVSHQAGSPDTLCGGPGRGSCVEGRCRCEPGYTGTFCGCPVSVNSCLSANGVICNNHGNCICGECECSSHYSGPLCEQYILD